MNSNASRFRYYGKLILWILLVQFVLANISASIYAYRFTHFKSGEAPVHGPSNFFRRTWKIFTGPSFYKNPHEPIPAFPVEKVWLRGAAGDSLSSLYAAADSARGSVLLLHGITANRSFLFREAQVFHSWGYNVFLPDFRAHGESTGSVTTFGIREADDVALAFNWLRHKSGDRIIVYGVSMGAVAAFKAIADKKILPAGLIADAPFNTLYAHFRARAGEAGFPAEPFASLVTFWTGIENGFDGFEHSVVKYAGSVNCPVMLEWGEKDYLISRTAIDAVYTALPGKQKKFVVYPEANHESYLGVDAMKWKKEVGVFLEHLP